MQADINHHIVNAFKIWFPFERKFLSYLLSLTHHHNKPASNEKQW